MSQAEIRCATCPHLKVTFNNLYGNNQPCREFEQGNCRCIHDCIKDVFSVLYPKKCSKSLLGNIGYTQPGSTQPEVKSHPHWCPRALMVEPYKITKARAYDIINQCLPLGLFYVNENDTLFTGIDNRTGEVWTEEFSSQEECFQWLLDPNKES